MEVNINSKRKPYEVGDLVEISGFGFRMIIKNNDNQYFLMNMEGQTTTSYYSSPSLPRSSLHCLPLHGLFLHGSELSIEALNPAPPIKTVDFYIKMAESPYVTSGCSYHF